MTEAEWLEGWAYDRMYKVVRSRATTRQVRLCMAACCRLKADKFFDPRIPPVLEAAEKCADDPAAEAVANALWRQFITSVQPKLPLTGPEGQFGRAITDVWRLADDVGAAPNADDLFDNAQAAITSAVLMSLRDRPRATFTGASGDALQCCTRAIDQAASFGLREEFGRNERKVKEAETQGRMAIAAVFRDIFGNPFRPIPRLDPAWLSWNDGAVRKMAQIIYDDRGFDRLPLLADALEEAGCADAAILAHCRTPGEHVRGCWVVDLLLGKT